VITTLPTGNVPAERSGPLAHAHVDYLDGWRGLAILLVLQNHFLPIQGFDTGELGVDIFFGLSGLLMSNLLFVKRIPLQAFYKRRVSRILPAFVLFVLVAYGTAAWLGNARSGLEIISTLTFLRTYIPAVPNIWSTGLPIGHLWSLNVEEHSYVFLSLIALSAAARGRETWILAIVSALMMGLYHIYQMSPSMATTSFEIRTEIAATFLLLSAGYFLVRNHFAHLVQWWMPLAAIPIAALGYSDRFHWWVGAIVSPIALAFSVNHLQQAPKLFLEFLSSTGMRYMGLWSFSIYLWQQPFATYKTALPPGVAPAGALLAGLISYYIVEKPSRAWINAHW